MWYTILILSQILPFWKENNMKKFKLMILIAALLLAIGCTSDTTEADETNQTESDTQASEADTVTIESRLEGLVHNEYPDLEMTAAVLERKSIIPGATFPVSITIKNNGDKTIMYIWGSSSYEIPESLLIDAVGLQPILPISHLGIATLDMKTELLEPGEELAYILHVRAIEPNDNFNQYTLDMYAEDQSYIGDIEWDKLQESFSDLVAAEPASYDIDVYFMYYILDAESENVLSEVTGYAASSFSITVSD